MDAASLQGFIILPHIRGPYTVITCTRVFCFSFVSSVRPNVSWTFFRHGTAVSFVSASYFYAPSAVYQFGTPWSYRDHPSSTFIVCDPHIPNTGFGITVHPTDKSVGSRMNGPRNWKKRQPYFTPSETPLTVSTKINTDLTVEGFTAEKATAERTCTQEEKENIPELTLTPDHGRKSRSISKQGLQAACLLEKFDKGADCEPGVDSVVVLCSRG